MYHKILITWRLKSYFVWKVQFKLPMIGDDDVIIYYQEVSTIISLYLFTKIEFHCMPE